MILLLLKISFGIDDAAFMHGYWIAAVAIVLGAVLINAYYNLIYFNIHGQHVAIVRRLF